MPLVASSPPIYKENRYRLQRSQTQNCEGQKINCTTQNLYCNRKYLCFLFGLESSPRCFFFTAFLLRQLPSSLLFSLDCGQCIKVSLHQNSVEYVVHYNDGLTKNTSSSRRFLSASRRTWCSRSSSLRLISAAAFIQDRVACSVNKK